MIRSLFLCGALLLSVAAHAQQMGTVRGVVSDAHTGETIPFANVLIKETQGGFTTDLDGAYSYLLPVGAYTFEVSYVGYRRYKVEGVVVKPDQITVINISIEQENQMLEEVTVEARQLQDTESSLLAAQRRSINVVNGISSQMFTRVGDNNAGSAIKRVTGVSVDDGKYVSVRGLGDRYSKTLLNGIDIPSLNPNRNTLQIDIFPTNILDNLTVSKTATANLPADFAGGIVNVATRDFPDEKTIAASLTITYNPSMHFRSDFLAAERSATDALGFDNGLRSLPVNEKQDFPAAIDNPQLTRLTARFRNNMAARKSFSLPNFNFGFSAGDQIRKEKVTLGYNAALSYIRTTQLYEDLAFDAYLKERTNNAINELRPDRTSLGSLGIENTLLSAMLGGALKVGKHKLSLTLLHLQNGESKAGVFTQNNYVSSVNQLFRHNVEYTQSSITNVLLQGTHQLNKSLSIAWKFSPTYSSIADKDVRTSPFKINDGAPPTIEPSEGAQPARIWRNLAEMSYNVQVDVEKTLSLFGRKLEAKAGIWYTHKKRDYSILNYLMRVEQQDQLSLSGNPDELLLPQNIWTPARQAGTYISFNFERANTYSATQQVIASYLMASMDVVDRLTVNAGIRMEAFTQRYTGESNSRDQIYDNQKTIDQVNFLPSTNLIYRINKSMNLRASYAMTLARPSFKEASIAQIYDPLSNRTFIGNIKLKQSIVSNYDLRWEWFGDAGQTVSVGGFYKSLIHPIEIVYFNSASPTDLQPKNMGKADLIGAEFEFRKHLSFIAPSMKPFYVGGNFSYIFSALKIDKSLEGEYASRDDAKRLGERVHDTRPMQGQAPYVVNAYVGYTGPANGWEALLIYNVQGRTLSVVGFGYNPDVYTVPYHDLSCRISKQLGPNRNVRLSIGVNNILSSEKVQRYESYQAAPQLFDRYRPRRSFTLAISWRIR